VAASFEERVFQLGVDELAEQERQVAEIRGRAPALLAAGAVVPSLLAHAVFHGHHPHGFVEVLCTSLGLLGAGVLLVATGMLLWPRELAFSVNARATYQALWDQQILEQPMLDLVLADTFHDRREDNVAVVTKMKALLGLAVMALAVEAAGFAAAAALAS
jgi:hypothetical protein